MIKAWKNQWLCPKQMEFHRPYTHIQSDLFTQHPVRHIFSALGSAEHVDKLRHWPWRRRHHSTVQLQNPHAIFALSYQHLIPHLLCIMQTIAYSIMTCPPVNPHRLESAPSVILWLIMNAEWGLASRLTEGLTAWGTLRWWRSFPQLSVPLHSHIEMAKWISRLSCCKEPFHTSSVYAGYLWLQPAHH